MAFAANNIGAPCVSCAPLPHVRQRTPPAQRVLLLLFLVPVRSLFQIQLSCLRPQVLQDEADEATQRLARIQARVDRLQHQMDTSARRLRSAATLTASLTDEADRWAKAADDQEAALATVPAAALLDAAALTYLGPLRAAARAKLLRRWRLAIRSAGLALPPAWSVQTSLGDAAELRTWWLQV